MAWIAVQIVLCILVADFLTGVAHWLEDAYGLPTWPVLGPTVIKPNIDHHSNPAAMCAGSLVSRNYQMWLLAAAAVTAAWLAGHVSWQLSLTAAFASFGNEFHAWTHGKAPRLVRVLQDMGLLVSPRQHAKHHRAPFDQAFCTITCWVNPVLDATRFWKAVEWALACCGVQPKRMTAERGYL
jgi:hypothetical protein